MRARGGFTLIELLVVVVVLGLLASIAVAGFSAVRNRSYVAAMQSDLRGAVIAQMSYAESQNPPMFAADTAALGDRFRASTDVTVTFSDVSGAGFGAVATHKATRTRCAVFEGPAVTAPATIAGKITCD